jgi:hypothetical protein
MVAPRNKAKWSKTMLHELAKGEPFSTRIAKTVTRVGVTISTVYLSGLGFETMVFDDNTNESLYCRRSDTRVEALETHILCVNKYVE